MNRAFTASESNRVQIFEPMPFPVGDGSQYFIKLEDGFFARSRRAPLIIWGDDARIPTTWKPTLDRASLWKIPHRPLLNGSEISVHYETFEVQNRHVRPGTTGKTLIAVKIRNMRPTKEALQWLEEQIAERKGWFE